MSPPNISQIEMRPKKMADLIQEMFEGLDKTVNITIDVPTRVSISVTPPLTAEDKATLKSRMPPYIRKCWGFTVTEPSG